MNAALKGLQGVRVLDLTRYMLGGFPTLLFGDLGAEVIKIEEIGKGDFCRAEAPLRNGVSHYFTALCRNKKSLTLNLKAEKGRAIFLDLVKAADVVIENYRPGVTRRLGIDYESLRALNPRIVYCSMSGFGQDDPLSLAALHDVNLQAMSGFTDLFEGRLPPLSLCDIATGMCAAQGMALALFQRERTGLGQHVDVPMFDSLVWWMSVVYARYDYQGESISPRSLEYPSLSYNILRTKDGYYLSLGMIEEKFWEFFCRETGNEDLIPLQKRYPHEEPEAYERLCALAASKTRAEWQEWLQGKDMCIFPARTAAEAIAAVAARPGDLVDYVDYPGLGPILQTNTPIRFSAMPHELKMASPPPGLGEHNREILRGLGYSEQEIQECSNQGVIGKP